MTSAISERRSPYTFRQPAYNLDALGRLDSRPRSGVECDPGGLHGRVDIGRSGGGNLRHRRFGMRGNDLDALVSARFRPPATNEQFVPAQASIPFPALEYQLLVITRRSIYRRRCRLLRNG
jgi:hypothetical protein